MGRRSGVGLVAFLVGAILAAGGLQVFRSSSVAAQAGAPARLEGFEFPTGAPVIRYHYPTKAARGTVFQGVWIAEDVAGAAAHFVIGEAEAALEDAPSVAFSLTRPNRGWPRGLYRLEVRVGARLVHMARFVVR